MSYYDFLIMILLVWEFRREFMVAFQVLHIYICFFKAKNILTHLN